jgi:hypothetical protein
LRGEYHSTPAVLCALIGVAQPGISLWLSGERALSLKLQIKIMAALAFFEELQSRSELPLDLSKVDAVLLTRWEKFKRIRMENEVIKTDDEIEDEAGASD